MTTSTVTVRRAGPADAKAVAALAAATFPSACPPHTTAEAIAAHIAANLSEERFAEFLADAGRIVLVAEGDLEGVPCLVGYTMLVPGEPADDDARASVSTRPTIELSKVYSIAAVHGTGVGAALISATIAAARATGARSIWLGVNQENERANRFYAKYGFEQVGTKRFLVGDRFEDDFVRELVL
jgi:tRNA (guanine37-N1)-methyltransferase